MNHIGSNTSVWIEHNSDSCSHCMRCDVSCKFNFDLACVSVSCHYFSPADSVSSIIYCVFHFIYICNSFSSIPSCTSFIMAVLNCYKCLIFLLWHSWSHESCEHAFCVKSHWLRLFEGFFLSCFNFLAHFLFYNKDYSINT